MRQPRRGICFGRDALLCCLLQIARLLLRPVPLDLAGALALRGSLRRLVGRLQGCVRRRVLRNLKRACPGSSEARRARIAAEVFANMGRSLVELLKIERVESRLDDYVRCEGFEVVEEIGRRLGNPLLNRMVVKLRGRSYAVTVTRHG